ncbi:hypothetical protein J4Q44_G00055900 [Coregonus suidteri]|uniref:Uncharacterized protein n=1 Tax=Coregonus suidteri TaxID=861788 RepID=A0AAN8NAC0_9TELE
MFFVNATVLKIQGECNGTIGPVAEGDDMYLGECNGTMYLLPLVVILGFLTAVLLIVILILVLKIRRDAKTHNIDIGAELKPQNSQDPDQNPDSLNYAALSFRQKRPRNKKTAKRQMMETEPNVVYASTR